MKPNKSSRFCSFFLSLLLCFPVLTVCGAGDGGWEEECRAVWETAYQQELTLRNCQNEQELWDKALPEEVGVYAEAILFALFQRPDAPALPDPAALRDALTAAVSNASALPVPTQLKQALALHLVGGEDAVCSLPLNALYLSGKMPGIMSFVTALLLTQNGVKSQLSAAMLCDDLLKLQNEDGGFGIRKDVSEVDVTAMTIQALALCPEENGTAECIEKALLYLSSHQTDSGSFIAYGVENAESCAQVLIALSSLGIAPDDPRFVKNGHSVWDAMLSCRLENGAFSHGPGGAEDRMATIQALTAAIAVDRSLSDYAPFYAFSKPIGEDEPQDTLPAETDPPAETTVSESTTEPAASGKEPQQSLLSSLRLPLAIGILLITALICVILFAKGKRRIGSFLPVLLIGLLAVCLLFFIRIETPDSFYRPAEECPADVPHVTLTIRSDTVAGQTGERPIPSDGILLHEVRFAYTEGMTVYDLLMTASRSCGFPISVTGVVGASSELAYVNGIAQLFEFEFGDLSGWVYRVNGESPSVGCGSFLLSEGDAVSFCYTLDLGQDIP